MWSGTSELRHNGCDAVDILSTDDHVGESPAFASLDEVLRYLFGGPDDGERRGKKLLGGEPKHGGQLRGLRIAVVAHLYEERANVQLDLIEPIAEARKARATGTSGAATPTPAQMSARRPRRADITST